MSAAYMMRLAAMVAYMVLIVVVGVIYSKKNKTSEGFYLGDRGLGPWVVAMSAEASDMSGWLLMGLPGLAYVSGLADAGWTAIGLAIGTYLNWLITGRRLRIYTKVASNSITLPDFFSNRFHDQKKILMNIAALIILVFFIPYTAAGFMTCGNLFNSLFGFNYLTSMIISSVIIVIYTVIGGFLAESTVDFIQGTLMFIALLLIVVLGVVNAGGIGNVIANANALPGFNSLFYSYVEATGTAKPYGALGIASGLAWGLGYFGMPHVLLRFMAIRDANEMKKARRIGTTWVLITMGAALAIGMIGRSLYPVMSGIEEFQGDPERIFVVMCMRLLNTGLLPIIAGIMLCGVLAAQISTSDSQLLVASSAISQNFYKGLIRTNASEKEVMWVSRVTIVVIAVLGVFVAALVPADSTIFKVVSFAWAGFGAAFGPLVLFMLFWRRMNIPGAIAGIVVGGASVLIWKFFLSGLGGFFGIYELAPAFVLSCIAIVVVSLLTKAPQKSVLDEFDAYKKEVAQR